jgi:hypothetical protein
MMRLIFLRMFAAIAVNAAPIQFQSSERQTSLLELYTSEGCSSCPPAEAWLSKLKTQCGLWTDFVPVAFHVDYWNSLGWRDQWSKEEFSDRQRAYAGAWGSENIYTPELVLNGREWSNWFGWKGAPGKTGDQPGVLEISSDDTKHWVVTFAPAQPEKIIYDVHAALLASGVSSDVKAGENAGRLLAHDFVVAAFTEVPLVGRSNEWKNSFTLDATQKTPAERLALAVWLTRHGEVQTIQAVGGWLPADMDKQQAILPKISR